MTFDVIIDGSAVTAIYDDRLVPVFAALGLDVGACTTRASAVEPIIGGWTADLAASGGPVLGPFATRQAALDAEVAWLRAHL